jgi:toxin ParE1/3/4
MARIQRTRAALNDLLDLWIHVAEGQGDARANAFIKKIEKVLLTLSNQPFMGRARPELREHLRSFPVNPYILFYEPRDDGILLVRVIHGRRDIDALFSDAPE